MSDYMLNWLSNTAVTVLVFAAIAAVAFAAAAIMQRGMNRTSANMSKKHGGLQVHPYMEMFPGKFGRVGGMESEIMVAPNADLSKEEKEDPQRA